MLAQLLGMGRKKDPPKHNSTTNDGPESPIERQDSEDRSSTTGALFPGGAALSPSAVSTNTAAMGPAPAAPSPLSASTSHHPNPNGPAGDATAASAAGCQAELNCGCCSGAASCQASSACSTAAGTAVAAGGASGAGGGGVSGSARGSLVPSPPTGPAAFSSPAVTTAVVQQPLGQKQAFSSEAAAVERGLNLQLGDTGAATESQLGGQQLEAAKKLRNLLTTNRERVVQEMLGRGWVPLLLRWLGLAHRPNLQVEALSALTTVAQTTTEHTSLLLKHGAVGTLVSLLKSPSLEMVEQAMWVLGKLAQDGPDGTTTARDAVLQAGVLGPLVRCLEQHSTLLSLQRIGAWSLFNLLDGQPRPTIDVATVNMVMPAINRLLMAGDSEVLSHACSALSHLCDGSAAHIKVVVESGVCKRLVQLLDHPSSQVVKPALRTIGNVVCAEDDADYTEAILEAGSVVCLKKLIAHPNREIQKEACWTLSNIAAGSVSQIQSVLDSGAMPQLIKLATSADTESEVRSEAFWVVLNAASCGSDAQIEYLVSQGCVQILSDLLGESSMVMMALEGIERVLSVGDLRVVRNAIASHSHGDQGPEGEVGVGDHGEGGHCMECASVAAVGAATAAGQGGIGGEGLGGGEAGAYTNPYACMLTPEKIQALEAHKNSAVAKRANRVWARYFVTCAICRGSFSRHGSSAAFCTECNCHVCGTCDCTIFHLAYQDKLWEEMEGKEKRGKKAQQTAKKNKKAKKREKKKNAAKELAEEATASPKGDKAGGVGGRATGDKNAPGGGGKRANGNGGVKQRDDDNDAANGVSTQQRSQDLGKKSQGHDRSDSPNKASSSASTESNSEDEYSPPCPPNAPGQYSPNGALPVTSAAAALINATAMAVTSAATAAAAAAAKKKNSGADGTVTLTATATATVATTSPKKSRGNSPAAATATASSPAADSSNNAASRPGSSSKAEDERAQRRAGKKQGRRDQQQQAGQGQGQQHAKSLFSALATSSSGSSAGSSAASSSSAAARVAAVSRAPDDDGEEPWVVVGGAGGKRAGGGAKWSTKQRAPAPAAGGGAAKSSSVVWASESSPADVAVRAATPVRPTSTTTAAAAAASPSAAPAVPPRVPTAPPAHAQVAPGGPVGNAWGGAASALKPPTAPPLTMAPSNGLQSAAASGTTNVPSHLAPQRPAPGPRRGPGPGSVWGASASIPDPRPKPFLVAAAAVGSTSPAATAPVPGAPGFVRQAGNSRAPGGPANPAGVIGPRPQATATTKAKGKTKAPPGSPAMLVPDTRGALAPVPSGPAGKVSKMAATTTTAAAAAAPVVRVKGKGGQGGTGGGDGGGENEKLGRTVSQGSEALRENEKLVSFLLETGSILALAQRLEDEEEWRRAAPSPINSRPG